MLDGNTVNINVTTIARIGGELAIGATAAALVLPVAFAAMCWLPALALSVHAARVVTLGGLLPAPIRGR